VLVVDDDPAIRRMLGRALSSVYEIIVLCCDGEVALEEIRRVRFDLVLLDLRMPVLDGWRVLEILEAEGPDVPVLLMSGECQQLWPDSPLVRARHVKTDGLGPLLEACERVLSGENPGSPREGR
jgi:CheY-like chemotaxis protein